MHPKFNWLNVALVKRRYSDRGREGALKCILSLLGKIPVSYTGVSSSILGECSGKEIMIKRVLAILSIVVIGFIVPTAPANAGIICNTTGICGVVINSTASNRSLLVATNWPTVGAPNTIRLQPGQSSKTYTKDADGFFIPYGCTGSSTPGWHKIVDGQLAQVRIIC